VNKAISACWIIVTLAFAWQTFNSYQTAVHMRYLDIPAWRQIIATYATAVAASAVIAGIAFWAKGRWVGGILVVGSFVLGWVSIGMLVGAAFCHGCNPSAGDGLRLLIFGIGALLSFVTGIRMWKGVGKDEAV
jgi:hypothetical protein